MSEWVLKDDNMEELESGALAVGFPASEMEQGVTQRFEEMVRLFARRTAVDDGSIRLSYRELNAAANWVAHALLARLGDESEPVALILTHGVWPIIAILGILKAGKFYVPLEPSFPVERCASMLRNAGARLLITDPANQAAAQEAAPAGCELLVIGDKSPASLAADNPNVAIRPDSIAFIIYTSGSTGEPKGVYQTHRNLLWLIRVYTLRWQVVPNDRFSLVRTVSFNGTVKDIFVSLLNGASLHPFDLKARGHVELARWLHETRITICISVVSVIRQLSGALPDGAMLPHLRALLCGGEVMYPQDVLQLWRYTSKQCVLEHSLGTSETGVTCCIFIDRDTPLDERPVPSGYVVDDVEVWLVDEDGNRVAEGEAGEIYVRSPYLACGYWRQPELTAERFFPDPEGGVRRIYRTGDMGRFQADGCLEHLGRIDFQVKVNGIRVEAGEVETALLNLDGIAEAAVTAGKDRQGHDRFVAYIVPVEGQELSVSAIRRALAAKLPSSLIPHIFVFMQEMPKTLLGKTDRKALPEPPVTRPAIEARYTAPRTPIEARLAELWAAVLGLDRVGVDDPFLELGGSSLLASEIVARILAEFEVELTLSTFFEKQTIANLAQLLSRRRMEQAGAEVLTQLLTEIETRA